MKVTANIEVRTVNNIPLKIEKKCDTLEELMEYLKDCEIEHIFYMKDKLVMIANIF